MEAHPRTPRVTAVRREEERVTALELFFDLVFVLALTQCTALMATDPTWQGLGRGLLVLAVLWWSWGGYAWLTSVVDPEEGTVRLAMFAAMAAFLVAALVGAGRVRKRRVCLRVRLRDRPGGAHLAVHDREPRRSGPAAVRHGPCGQHGRRRRPAPRSFDDRRLRSRERSGASRSSSTSARRSSSGRRAGA